MHKTFDAQYITTVARLKKDLFKKVINVQNIFKEIDYSYYYYPVSDIHLTIIGADLLKEFNGSIVAIKESCEQTFRKYSKFQVQLCGINFSPWSIFIKVEDSEEIVKEIRNDFMRHLPNRKAFKNSLHINIVRLTHTDISHIVERINKFGKLYIGEMLIDEIDLVKTDKLLSSDSTKIIKKFKL